MYLLVSNTESFDEDDEEEGEGVVEEELVYKPWIPNGTKFDILQSILFVLFGELWFLTTGPVAGMPMILAELPEKKNCWTFFKKQNYHE